MFKLLRLFIPLLVINAVTSCSSGEKTDDAIDPVDSTELAVLETRLNAQNVFNSMPDRREILKLIEENRIEYNSDFLNDPQMVDKYTLETSKAANLGIYGSDLSIASSFDQTQESVVFLKCVNSLARDLGVDNAFDQKMFDRMEAYKQNKDSTLEIITSAFKSADEILKSNNRPATSAIILAGAWIEGLYVSCRIAESVNSENIVKSIIKQRESLKNLVVMLEAAKLDERSQYLLTGLKGLLESFKTAEETNTFKIETIAQISAKASELRKKIVSGLE